MDKAPIGLNTKSPQIPKTIISPWTENIGKNLIKNVVVTIGDNKTIVENIDGKMKIEHYYKDTLQKTENEMENKYYYLDKQKYNEIELNRIYTLISKHPKCIIEKHDIIDLDDSACDKLSDIANYIYGDKYVVGDAGYYNFIYNNISICIQSDSYILNPSIEFKYVREQIDECDLNTMKKTFKFLNKEMYGDNSPIIFEKN